ncbi:hypothetical protein Pcinc_015830 [Petrolisthes cinctipes]|uniref:Transmembrane protein 170B n=1 Tax=Petrolisthes cinctipes TaxID=88211 RepID=A0AAE1FTH9_PETCI|nr:hypothetical protein Pcinc_015830 [Petrolisthes cinctipes]
MILLFWQIQECNPGRMVHCKGWSFGGGAMAAVSAGVASLTRVVAGLVAVWGPGAGLLRGARAVVAYSTRQDSSSYAEVVPEEDQELETFPDLWQGIFLWSFFSVMFIHVVSAIIAFLMLRQHKYGRFSAACVLLIGLLTTLVMSAATSAAIGFVLYQAKIPLQPIHAMICGISQTALLILFSFSRFMPTL